jgi:hypothetical protein
VVGAGAEEPNALVQVKLGGAWEPMARRTEVELFDGLEAFGLAGRDGSPRTAAACATTSATCTATCS